MLQCESRKREGWQGDTKIIQPTSGRTDLSNSKKNSKKVEKDVGQGFVPENDVDRLAAGGNDKKTKKHV